MPEQAGDVELARCGCQVGGLHYYGCALVGYVDSPRQTGDVERLAEVLCVLAEHLGASNLATYGPCFGHKAMAAAITASDWLADQRAAWEAEARAAALAEVAAEMAAHRDSWRAEDFDGADADYGRWDAWSNAARIVRDLAAGEGVEE